jgi:hypothetical protein
MEKRLTEFTAELRHMCRNPKCRSKLKTPVTNLREAFCARGCHSSFYRKRCLVCEEAMVRKTERQLVCGKRKCRNALQARSDLGRYHASQSVVSPSEIPDFIGSKVAVRGDRGTDWAIAVNRARIRAPRYVLDAVFGRVALST